MQWRRLDGLHKLGEIVCYQRVTKKKSWTRSTGPRRRSTLNGVASQTLIGEFRSVPKPACLGPLRSRRCGHRALGLDSAAAAPGSRFSESPSGDPGLSISAHPTRPAGGRNPGDARPSQWSFLGCPIQPRVGLSSSLAARAGHWSKCIRSHTGDLLGGGGFSNSEPGRALAGVLFFSRRSIPFQCRILKHPALATPEITVWATCLEGRWEEIVYGSTPDLTGGPTTLSAYLQESWRTVVTRWVSVRRLLKQPFTQNARKQFVRLSQPITTDWQTALADLERFAQLWLEPRPEP